MTVPGYQVPANLYRDPTAVVGTRILAWIVDLILYLALMLLVIPPFSPLAEKTDVPEGMSYDEVCNERLPDAEDAAICIMWDDTAYWTDGDDSVVQLLVSLGWWFLVHVLLQGIKGFTPGKALLGLRVVGEDGQPPGIGRALLRSLLWVVDGQPCGIPLVGFILALSSTGHRRLGDMAAKTYVVGKADAGRPVQPPGATPAAAFPSGYGVSPPVGVGAPGYPASGQAPTWGTPPGGPSAPGAPGAPGGTGPAWPSSPPTAPTPATTPQPGTTWGGTWGQTPPGPPATTPFPQPGGPETAPAPTTPTTPSPGDSSPPAGTEASPGTYGVEGQSPTADAGASEAEASSDRPGGPSSEDLDTTMPVDREDAAPGETAADSGTSEAGTGAADSSPAETEVMSADTTPATAEQPGGGEIPAAGGTAGTVAGPAPTYQPQWDAARGTYIQWDPNRNHWLQWDDTAKEWRPL